MFVMTGSSIFLWIARIIAALIMLQTLYFKFTGQPESVHLFTVLNLEPEGRIGIGIAELVASILILIPRTSWLGAMLGAGLMAGAIFFHLTKLGIAFEGSSLLFIYAVVTLLACLYILWAHRVQIPVIKKLFQP